LARYFSVPQDSTSWGQVVQRNAEIAKQHGKQRACQTGYTLDQVIAEHQILRRVLLSYIQQRLKMNPDQWTTLLQSVDVGISESATAFALERGFKDARYQRLEAEMTQAWKERGQARSALDNLQIEKAVREQFVFTLSHDLRTPITSAKAAAELIVRDPRDTKQVAALAFRVIDDLSRSDRMIRDLLDANRIRAGEKMQLEAEEIELISLIKETLGNLSRVYGDRFVLKADHEITGFWSGKDLERSLENLAINAVKYGAADTPIEVRVADLNDKVSLSVHNFGSLITPEEQESLFQPFTRIQSAIGKGAKGWGLGLTLVLGITESHGGTIEVKSDAEKGTTFTMIIPKDSRATGGKAA
jgi:signal transduction histidine kinase